MKRMPSLEPYAPDFFDDVKSRGRDYFRRKAVRLISNSATTVLAVVEGSDKYLTRVQFTPGEGPSYECNCPAFSDYEGPCKHCWATILQAQAESKLPPLGIDSDGERLEYDPDAGRAEMDADEDREGADDMEDQEENEDEEQTLPRHRPRSRMPTPDARHNPSQRDANAWKKQLGLVSQTMRVNSQPPMPPLAWPAGRKLIYQIDKLATFDGEGLTLELTQESPRKDGGYDRPKQLRLRRDQIAGLPEPIDRQIVQMLMGAMPESDWGYTDAYYDGGRRFIIPEAAYPTLLKMICDTGRCRIRESSDGASDSVAWDDGPVWEFWLEVKPSPGGRYLVLDGAFRRTVAETIERLELNAPTMVVRGLSGTGLLFANGKVASLDDRGAFDLLAGLRDGLKMSIPIDQKEEFLRTLFAMPRLPRIDLPEDLRVDESRPAPRPRLKVRRPAGGMRMSSDERLTAELAFDYAGLIVEASKEQQALISGDGRTVVHRDLGREAEFLSRLTALGFREAPGYWGQDVSLRLAPSKLPRVVAELTREGWHVEAEGKLYRQAGEFQVQVRSGIDWFELHGDVQFGDIRATLPQLLAALRRGDNAIKLDDGSFGLLPQDWLAKYASLAGMGEANEDHLRFSARQVGFLDALLAAMPEARFDETFRKARDELLRFDGIEAQDPPDTFKGELRGYQREGLGWTAFLRRFSFGGCLADDMGLGKTVQVLALLEKRRRAKLESQSGSAPAETPRGPSLVVAPRSLVFNWKQEAARFTPDLRVLDHTSVARDKNAERFGEFDLVLTTYGTLRRDMNYFKDVKFDYAILDEAQAIKNSSSESAKAARLIQADHRLALSGTPVQNHLGELWSLFEFLNPGMMGAAGAFRDLSAASAGADPEAREMLSRALRPFILRRTKDQVARDLPEKTEQTVFCELEPAQRKLYDELRDHYRTSLLERVARDGMNKAKIMVLEALLRLRQAACHPGLIDKKRMNEPSAKLDSLLANISEVLQEGHKVLVFSQFTSMLAIVRSRLDKENIPYEYLDGKTKDRQARVERFQNDPGCKLFLISLKAGGLGLNLTSAEYVFLLDPWWNPAVEAQAIDRAHRIGQTQKVFAYRLIAKDTVEEKVLQLQNSKKELADAIINADNSLIRTINREDLEMLLS